MKTISRVILLLTLLAIMCLANAASAFYDPSTQRWINRDPINEPGFEAASDHPGYARVSSYGHEYAFLKNMPVALIDPLGLKVYPGKKCKLGSADYKKMMAGFLAACKAAQGKKCFDCLKENAANMATPCDPVKYADIVVECEPATAQVCLSTRLRTNPCGHTDPGTRGKHDPDYPGKKVVHVCMGTTWKCDYGCTLLHEVAHAAGGVGGDKADSRARDIELCAGCP